jgi:transposase-like protein
MGSEVISVVERRRRWSTEEKLEILVAALEPGASITAVADRYGVARNLVYQWMRLAREGRLDGLSLDTKASAAFVPVHVAPKSAAPPPLAPPPEAARAMLPARRRAHLGKFPGRSDLAGAIRYARSRWGALTRYLDDGRLEISNNAAENQIRPAALGRKNWLFCGSDAGGERAAAFYTLIRTAKLNGLEPEAWLTDVIARIGSHPINRLAELLPWSWSPATTHSVAA